MSTDVPFDTNVFFAGGAGMFIEYHDVAKPVYLMAVLKLITSRQRGCDLGLPIEVLSGLSPISLIEWYLRRRYRNPLRCIDYQGKYSEVELDAMLSRILADDPSLYRLAPTLNLQKLLGGYHHQNMQFPIYFYTEADEPSVAEDCKRSYQGLPVTYLHGDLKTALESCDQNFTYMVSSIGTLTKLAELLTGTCSHILLAGDYRYNYNSTVKRELKVNLKQLMLSTPYLRLETNTVCDPTTLVEAICQLVHKNDHREDI